MLKGKKIELREINPKKDAVSWFSSMQDEKLHEWTGNTVPNNIKEVEDLLGVYKNKEDLISFVIVELDTNQVVGTYWLMKPVVKDNKKIIQAEAQRLAVPYWRKGYMKEARNLIYHYAFETLGVSEIYAQAWLNNENSIASMKHMGYVEESIYERYFDKKQETFTEVQLVLSKDYYYKYLLKQVMVNEGLGIVNEIEPLTGGFLHKMYKITTEESYAVKLMNPEIMSRDGVYDNICTTEVFSKKVKDYGLPAITTMTKEPIIKLWQYHFMIFPYVNGETKKNEDLSYNELTEIAKLYEAVHKVTFKSAKDTYHNFDFSKFKNDTKISQFTKNYDILMEINSTYVSSQKKLPFDVYSHRDMDAKNILWDKGPKIIDWEASGAINRSVDLLRGALYFSEEGKDQGKFKHFINQLSVAISNDAFYGVLGSKLGWLEYMLKKVTGLIPTDNMAKDILSLETTITEILEYYNSIPNLIKLMEKQ